MLFNHKRHEKLFHLLVQRKSEISPQVITKQLGVSSRTIRSDILLINQKIENFGAKIILKRGKGYQLHILDVPKYEAFQKENQLHMQPDYFDINHPKERVKYIIYILLLESRYIKLENLANTLYISRATIGNDMKLVRKYLIERNLILVSKAGKGIKVDGPEDRIRYCLTELIATSEEENYLAPFFNWKHRPQDVEVLCKEVETFFTNKEITFTDKSFQNLILHLLIMIERVEKNYSLEDIKIVDNDTSIQKVAHELLVLIGSLFDITFSEAEEKYLTLQILSKRIFNTIEGTNSSKEVSTFINTLLLQIKSHYAYDLTKDIRLTTDLISHVHSMLYRVKNKLSVRNPMKDYIKRYYPLAYEVTWHAAESLKYCYPYQINQNELAYLALHIGASLERNYKIAHYRHKSALIVCGSGTGTARIVEARIKSVISGVNITKNISMREYNSLLHVEEDIVISTIKIEEKNKKVIQVSPIPTKEDLTFLEVTMENKVVAYQRIISSFFYRSFFLRSQCRSKKELLKQLTTMLEKEKIVPYDFFESVIERETLGSTIIGTSIAIPHPMRLMANETKIMLAILDEPIEWYEDQKAQVIFLLAISKEDYEETIEIYDLLVELVRQEYLSRLLNCVRFQDFKLLIEEVSKK
jgi:activator of the mannose operon (transcriptional antiterminator)